MAKWGIPFLGEQQILDSKARSLAPGKFIELPDGMVHYEIAGPPEGQPVVFINNLSHPYYIWDPTFDALIKAGFRVVRYDLYGRGYSDRPDVVYDKSLFDRQLFNLITALGVDRPVDLVGLSLGGALAVIFTDQHPAMVRKLCLVAPAGFVVRKPFFLRLLLIPVLGELLVSLPGMWNSFPEKARPQTKYAGFKRSYLSSVRHAPIFNLGEIYERVGKQKRPVLVVWGRRDPVHTAEAMEPIKKTIPHVEFHALDAAQDPHSEQPEVVNPILIEFLSNNNK